MVSVLTSSGVKMPENVSRLHIGPVVKPADQGRAALPVKPQTEPASAAQTQVRVPAQGQALTSLTLDSAAKLNDSLKPTPPTLAEIKAGKVIALGAEGPAVEQLQALLTKAGHPVQVNGCFGPMTEALLKDFQRENNIQVNGQLGPTTLKALENPLRETPLGRRLANVGKNQALNLGGYNSLGLCYTGVGISLEKVGVRVTGLSAYMAASQLERNPRFREVKVQASQLPKLPAGAVVVWERSGNPSLRRQGGGFTHGHISISDGKGREMSDYIDTQRTSYYASNRFRVFLPN